MTIVLDAGALVAAERGDPDVYTALKRAFESGRPPVTHGGIVGQVWRGGAGRQALLARTLQAVDVVPLDDDLGRRAGVLLGAARTADVIDAALVLLATEGDRILTSDPADLRALVAAAGTHVEIVSV